MQQAKTINGINAVTIRNKTKGPALALLRMCTSEDGKSFNNTVTAMSVDESRPAGDLPSSAVVAVLPEAVFKSALGHLYPHGELQNIHLVAPESAEPEPAVIVHCGKVTAVLTVTKDGKPWSAVSDVEMKKIRACSAVTVTAESPELELTVTGADLPDLNRQLLLAVNCIREVTGQNDLCLR